MQHEGWEYSLQQQSVRHAAAAAACAARAGAALASFPSMSDYYTVTRALFSSEGGLVLRDIELAAWVSQLQSQELDLHWMRAKGGEATNGSSCVAVDVATQLLTHAPCNQSSPFICMRPSASSHPTDETTPCVWALMRSPFVSTSQPVSVVGRQPCLRLSARGRRCA